MGCVSSLLDDDQKQKAELNHEEDNEKFKKSENKPENDATFLDETEKKDENQEKFMAVKPWIGALVAPTNAPAFQNDVPQENLTLEYVNGYRCEDSRQNVFWTNDPSKIVYMTAAIGVVLNVNTNVQEFFGAGRAKEMEGKGHNDDVEALHVNSKRTLCATGQRGQNPLIFVWDIATKQIIARFSQGRGTRCVRVLRFSKDDLYLFTVDSHDQHNLHVFDIQKQAKVGEMKSGPDPIYDMDTGTGSYAAAISHKRGLSFATFDGQSIDIKKGITGGNIEEATSVCNIGPDQWISGSATGKIFYWQGNQCTKTSANFHNGAINAITFKDGKCFSSGFKDKTLKVWNPSSQQVEKTYSLSFYARSIDYFNGKIIVGTRDGQIITFLGDVPKTLINGHAFGEAWGLDVDYKTGYVLSIGDDNKILTFDPAQNKVIAESIINQTPGPFKKIGGASSITIYPPNQCGRAVCVNQFNGHVAIATNSGEVQVRAGVTNDKLSQFVFKSQVSAEWIEIVKYSPDGKYLAVGSHDNKTYIFSVDQNYQKISTCQKHNSYIQGLDWSEDSSKIQTICGAYEYLFFNANSGQQLTSGATLLRDEKWATFTCKLGWPVQGVFPPATDGTHVNMVDRNNARTIFATGDDWGFVNLYRNPNQKGCNWKAYRAHSSHVMRVKFDKKDEFLYSSGGYDRTIMKWKVTK